MPRQVSDEDALRLGGWNRSFARVRGRRALPDERIALLIDTNDDDRLWVFTSIYHVEAAQTWRQGSTQGVPADAGDGEVDEIAFAYGRVAAHAASTMPIAYNGVTYEVPIDSDGRWFFAIAAVAEEAGFPRRVG